MIDGKENKMLGRKALTIDGDVMQMRENGRGIHDT